MANTLKQIWEWLERIAAKRAATSSRIWSEHVKLRRREMLRRAAGQSGVY